jgi:ADP-ribose pyrophosphatase YjhB (NUDIX family)
MNHPESVAGVLFSPDRKSLLLILRRDVPVWVLPGGGIDPGESPEEAILREILEETTLSVKIVRLIGTYTPINRLTRTTLLFELAPLSGTPSSSCETQAAAYFPLSHLPPMPPPYPEWIADALLSLPPITRPLSSVTYLALVRHTLAHPILVFRFLLARLGFPLNTK